MYGNMRSKSSSLTTYTNSPVPAGLWGIPMSHVNPFDVFPPPRPVARARPSRESIEAAEAAGEGLDYDEALMNIATASVSAYVGTATGADKEKIQLIYGAITSFTISVFKDFQLELKRVYNENKSLNDINMTEVFAKATGRAAMDDATSYGTTLLENKCNDSGSASAEFLEAFTAWADATGQDVADIYYEDSKNHKKNQAGGGDQPNETPKTQ